MTPEGFRKLALSLEGAEEGAHMGHADFRVGGRIFATLSLAEQGYGVLLLDPERQDEMVADAPHVFSPVPGGWGKSGSTRLLLKQAKADQVRDALATAWKLRVGKNGATKKRKQPAKSSKPL